MFVLIRESEPTTENVILCDGLREVLAHKITNEPHLCQGVITAGTQYHKQNSVQHNVSVEWNCCKTCYQYISDNYLWVNK